MRVAILCVCIVIMGAAVLWPVIAYLPVDPMPGDFHINANTIHLYVPLTTCISASVVLTLFFWYMRK
ncbi:MAG TPA: DUF2905 family protein [Rhizomicrobium sp.]|jgi:hypothetical protein